MVYYIILKPNWLIAQPDYRGMDKVGVAEKYVRFVQDMNKASETAVGR